MNGNAQKLIKYLDGASKRFIIPVYQRNYDWKMEHCKQLYDDLVKIIRQNRKSHFFGYLSFAFIWENGISRSSTHGQNPQKISDR